MHREERMTEREERDTNTEIKVTEREGGRDRALTHTYTERGEGKTDYSVVGERVTKRAASGPRSDKTCRRDKTYCKLVN